MSWKLVYAEGRRRRSKVVNTSEAGQKRLSRVELMKYENIKIYRLVASNRSTQKSASRRARKIKKACRCELTGACRILLIVHRVNINRRIALYSLDAFRL